MRLNINRFTETVTDIAYEFKKIHSLNFISNSLLYCGGIPKLTEINESDEKSLLIVLEKTLIDHFIQNQMDKLQTEENIKEIVDLIMDKVKSNIEYYTNTLMYNKYKLSDYYNSDFDFGEEISNVYVEVEEPNEWLECPKCNLKPLIWTFDNGAYARCHCSTIQAESYNSLYKRTGKTYYETSKSPFCKDELKYNWNHYCITGENLFEKLKEQFNEIY